MEFTIEGLLLGLLAIAIGLAFTFYGFRLFLVLLPIWGFFAGFVLGAGAITALFGDAFLATVSGWVVGFIVGIVFAVLSYLYYWVAVVLLGGVLGYQLTLGVFEWLNLSSEGWIAFIVALIVGAIFAVAFVILRMPAVLVIVATALGGAAAAIAGVAIALGFVPVVELEGGIFGVHADADLGWLGLIALVILAIAGAVYQTRTVTDLSERISEDAYQNPGMGTPTGASPA